MNKEEACSDARKLITKYRKLLTWWTFVREVPRLMNSNIDVIFDLSTYFAMPFNIFMNQVEPMKRSRKKCIALCSGIRNDLEELCKNVDRIMNTVVTYNSESGIYDEYKIEYKNAMNDAWIIFLKLRDCKEEFIQFCKLAYIIFDGFQLKFDEKECSTLHLEK
ncbi:hypothetical protein CEXT_43401 [Caerostris extrusa]|uniref:Uncharacterized protein n=1 Tax=Caerostris extrusa TaxID=172846 RepID=A0AAV4XF38_CAEEX|nr:hypothetical protein CEXT_43401 [Caerostris extrusa]